MNVSVPTIERIAVADIDATDRLRKVDADYVELISLSMAEQGLRQPIEVRKVGKRFALIAGGHRLAAARLLEWSEIPGIVLKVNPLEAKLLEIDENLFRHELSPLDHSTFLAKRKEVYEEMHPETKNGGDKRVDQNDKLVVLVGTFSDVTAEKLGISRRTVERAVARFRAIAEDVRERISGTWIAESGSQLDDLAKLTPDEQRQVADFIAQWPGVKKVSEHWTLLSLRILLNARINQPRYK